MDLPWLEVLDSTDVPVYPPIPIRVREDGTNADEIVIGPFPDTGMIRFELHEDGMRG